MSRSSSTGGKDGFPERDPYQVLGIDVSATDAEITKAYRKLALKLHPDKQQQQLSQSEIDRTEKEFHNVQQARSFLLDAEHASAREKYKNRLVSQRVRKQADAARDTAMSANRKRMREELKRQEETAAAAAASKRGKVDNQQRLEKLSRQGKQMREEYAAKEEQEELERMEKSRRREEKEARRVLLEERQVRLRWSRKKITISPSEHSLASLLEPLFGEIERVEMTGSKGNTALVTFRYTSSCKPCVEAYADSEEMRASYVGKRKDRENNDIDGPLRSSTTPTMNSRDTENVSDWKLRQAAEREKLLRREMEAQDKGGGAGTTRDATTSKPFPPLFPHTDDFIGLDPLQKLEKAEDMLLKGIVSEEVLLRLKVGNRR